MEDIVVTTDNLVEEVVDTVEVTSENVDAAVLDGDSLVTVEPAEYYLTSAGIYTGRMSGNYPQWLTDYVRDALSTDEALDTNAVITSLKDRLTNAELGISQNLQSIQTQGLSLSALETSVVSRLDSAEAGIADLQTTKVTADEALTIATNLQNSTFGNDVDAYIGNLMTTYASANLAYASDYQTLVASYNGLSVSLTETNEVVSGVTTVYSAANGDTQPVTPQLGNIWIDANSVQYQYMGAALGWVRTDQSASSEAAAAQSTADQAATWAASASSFITAPDGSITGWQYADGSAADSYFTIFAQNFQISDGTNLANVPFSIQAGTPNLVKFDGIVEFTNTAMDDYENTNITINADGTLTGAGGGAVTPIGIGTYDSTTIDSKDTVTFTSAKEAAATAQGFVDFTSMASAYAALGRTIINGGYINTGLVNANAIVANTITANEIATNTITASEISSNTVTANEIASNTITANEVNTTSLQTELVTASYINALNIVAGSVAAENITGTTITGKTISGGTITGTTINASTINIRDLNLVNDANKSVDPFFTCPPSLGPGTSVGTNPLIFEFYTGFYTYNSSSSSTKRTIGTNGSKAFISETDATGISETPAGYLFIAGKSGTLSDVNVYIKAGTTTITSKTSTFSVNTDYNIGGFIFRLDYDSSRVYDSILCVRTDTEDISLSSTSSNPITIKVDIYWASSITYRNTGLAMLVSNL